MTTNTTEKFYDGRVFTSKIKHSVEVNQPLLPGVLPQQAPSLCGFKPIWPSMWITEGLEDLSACKICESAKEAIERGRQP